MLENEPHLVMILPLDSLLILVVKDTDVVMVVVDVEEDLVVVADVMPIAGVDLIVTTVAN